MKGLVEEYGGLIILVSVAIAVMFVTYTKIGSWYTAIYPTLGRGGEVCNTQQIIEPVLIVEAIEFEQGVTITEEMVRTKIKAYTDSTLSHELPLAISGLGQLDSSVKGVQYLLYSAQGESGTPISRKGIVLFY